MHRALSTYVLEKTRDGRVLADRLLEIVEGKLVITEQRVVVVSHGMNNGSEERVVDVEVAPSHRDVLNAIEQLREMSLGAPMKAEQVAAAHAKAELEGKSTRVSDLTDGELTRLIDLVKTPTEEDI